MGISPSDMERWKEENTFYCIALNATLSPERCQDNRNKRSLGRNSDPRSINGGAKLIHSNGYRPLACERCSDWKFLCEEVYARRKGREVMDMGLDNKEWIRTGVALQKASSIEEAAEDLGIGYTTLLYRISRRTELQNIVTEKGFGRRRISLDELRRQAAGPGAGSEKGPEASGVTSGSVAKDIPEAAESPEGPPAAAETGPSAKPPEAPDSPDHSVTFPLADVALNAEPVVTISIQISGVDISRLSDLIQSMQQGIRDRVPVDLHER